MLPELLDQIPPDQNIGSVTADSAYDTRKCHDAIAARNAHSVIPGDAEVGSELLDHARRCLWRYNRASAGRWKDF